MMTFFRKLLLSIAISYVDYRVDDISTKIRRDNFIYYKIAKVNSDFIKKRAHDKENSKMGWGYMVKQKLKEGHIKKN